MRQQKRMRLYRYRQEPLRIKYLKLRKTLPSGNTVFWFSSYFAAVWIVIITAVVFMAFAIIVDYGICAEHVL